MPAVITWISVGALACVLLCSACTSDEGSDETSTSGAGGGTSDSGGTSSGGTTGSAGSGSSTTGSGAGSSVSGRPSFVLVDDGPITHDRDYYKYTDDPSLPKNWLEPIAYADGTLVLEVTVLSTGDGATSGELPRFFYHVIIKRCYSEGGAETCGTKAGVLRAEIALDHFGLHRAEIPVRSLNTPFWEPGVDHPEWDFANAWDSVNGDLITQDGKPAFPVELDVKVTIQAP